MHRRAYKLYNIIKKAIIRYFSTRSRKQSKYRHGKKQRYLNAHQNLVKQSNSYLIKKEHFHKPRNNNFHKSKNDNSKNQHKSVIYYGLLCLIVFYIVGFVLNRIELHMVVKNVKKEGINYDSFRDMNISKDVIKEVLDDINEFGITKINKQESINDSNKILESTQSRKKDWRSVDALTLSILINEYNLIEKEPINKKHMNYLYDHLYYNNSFLELKSYYTSILKDIRRFPVPLKKNGDSYVTFDDSWNAYRSYGGNRRHEGTDLMPEENKSGYYPIVSMTDGVVEKLGWLEQGGYRVGIRSNAGAYFYYAHLDTYAPGLEVGNIINAGDFLGYMGDTGYGKEGTTGMFDVHLHLGIYVETAFGELSVNPYHILLYLLDETKK